MCPIGKRSFVILARGNEWKKNAKTSTNVAWVFEQNAILSWGEVYGPTNRTNNDCWVATVSGGNH